MSKTSYVRFQVADFSFKLTISGTKDHPPTLVAREIFTILCALRVLTPTF